MGHSLNELLNYINTPNTLDILDYGRHFLTIAALVENESNCSRQSCGAVLGRNYQVLGYGFNTCLEPEERCPRDELNISPGLGYEYCSATHAELVAIKHAETLGFSAVDADMFVTRMPCMECAKAIKEAGVRRVFTFLNMRDADYSPSVVSYFKDNNISVYIR